MKKNGWMENEKGTCKQPTTYPRDFFLIPTQNGRGSLQCAATKNSSTKKQLSAFIRLPGCNQHYLQTETGEYYFYYYFFISYFFLKQKKKQKKIKKNNSFIENRAHIGRGNWGKKKVKIQYKKKTK